jgi:predicted glutamine amidotransferase
MCRIVAYLGDPIVLDALTTTEPGGLIPRSQHCEEMSGNPMCPDGWKLGWLAGHNDEPVIMTGTKPAYMDENLANVPPGVTTYAAVGVVRLATPSTTISDVSNPLYEAEGGLMAFNCSFEPWPDMMPAWRGGMFAEHEAAIKDHTEPEHFMALWRSHRKMVGNASDQDVDGLVSALDEVRRILHRQDGKGAMTLVLVRQERLVALRWAYRKDQNTLYWAVTPQGVWVASEPVDPDWEWTPPGEQTITVLGPEGPVGPARTINQP